MAEEYIETNGTYLSSIDVTFHAYKCLYCGYLTEEASSNLDRIRREIEKHITLANHKKD